MGSRSRFLCASLLFCWLVNARAQSKFDGFAQKPSIALESPRINFGDEVKNVAPQQPNTEKSSNANGKFSYKYYFQF